MPQTGEQRIKSNIFLISPGNTTNLPLEWKTAWKILLLLHLFLPVLQFQHQISMHTIRTNYFLSSQRERGHLWRPSRQQSAEEDERSALHLYMNVQELARVFLMVCFVQLLFNNVFQVSAVSQCVNTKVSYQGTSETKGKHYQITNFLVGRKFTVNVYEAAIYCSSQADILRCMSLLHSFERTL